MKALLLQTMYSGQMLTRDMGHGSIETKEEKYFLSNFVFAFHREGEAEYMFVCIFLSTFSRHMYLIFCLFSIALGPPLLARFVQDINA